jgi:hypothetical protein
MVKCIKPPVDRYHQRRKADVFIVFRIININEIHEMKTASAETQSQSDKFKEAARDLDCDIDEKRWDAKLKKVVKHKPVEKPA